MAVIELDGLSLAEAEEAIAEVWSCLEEYDIPSPVMSVDVRGTARFTLAFSFEEPIWAKLVSLRLSSLTGSAAPRRMPHAQVARNIDEASRLMRAEEARTSFGSHIVAAVPLGVAAPRAETEPFRRARRR